MKGINQRGFVRIDAVNLTIPSTNLSGCWAMSCPTSRPARERLAAWLKYLENRSGSQPDPAEPLATYDFSWMWRELGIEKLRR
jgi:hypothetical protein